MVQRLQYRRRHCYATKSNTQRILKTPGGKLTFQTVKKRANGPMCGDKKCNTRLHGIPHLRPAEYKNTRLSKSKKTVHRAYGGSLCGECVRARIVRAFLVEEQKIVKKVLKLQAKKK